MFSVIQAISTKCAIDNCPADSGRCLSADMSAYDGIIRRQSNEIEQLRSQLQQVELRYEKTTARLGNDAAIKDTQAENRIATLHEEMTHLKRMHTVEVSYEEKKLCFYFCY